MSLLGFLNFFVFQWFFIRLAKVIDVDTNEIVDWKILKWVLPLTGWRSPYVFVNRKGKNLMKKYKHGLMVLKGSPVHKGHKYIFKTMEKECEFLTIIFGSSQEEYTKKIPFSVNERMQMGLNCLTKLKINDSRYLISSVKDINNMGAWSKYILDHVKSLRNFPVDAYYSGSDEDVYPFLNQTEIEKRIIDRDKVAKKNNFKSGSEIREMIYNCDTQCYKYVPRENWKYVRRLLRPV
jgi:nicotinamide mononucleotide adenylyltransferase